MRKPVEEAGGRRGDGAEGEEVVPCKVDGGGGRPFVVGMGPERVYEVDVGEGNFYHLRIMIGSVWSPDTGRLCHAEFSRVFQGASISVPPLFLF